MALIQPMPELSPEQLDALRADIAANGILQPVIKDQHDRIIDGNHRAAIAAELGIDYPVTVITVADDAEAWDKAVSLNCARRHMTREQVREVIRGEIQRTGDSDRAIARRVGCSPSTVGSVRAEVRQWAVDLTDKIRAQLASLLRELDVLAHLRHQRGEQWQAIAASIEPLVRDAMPDLDALGADVDIYGPLFGEFFQLIGDTECDTGCPVCLSNLDTEAVSS